MYIIIYITLQPYSIKFKYFTINWNILLIHLMKIN